MTRAMAWPSGRQLASQVTIRGPLCLKQEYAGDCKEILQIGLCMNSLNLKIGDAAAHDRL